MQGFNQYASDSSQSTEAPAFYDRLAKFKQEFSKTRAARCSVSSLPRNYTALRDERVARTENSEDSYLERMPSPLILNGLGTGRAPPEVKQSSG